MALCFEDWNEGWCQTFFMYRRAKKRPFMDTKKIFVATNADECSPSSEIRTLVL